MFQPVLDHLSKKIVGICMPSNLFKNIIISVFFLIANQSATMEPIPKSLEELQKEAVSLGMMGPDKRKVTITKRGELIKVNF